MTGIALSAVDRSHALFGLTPEKRHQFSQIQQYANRAAEVLSASAVARQLIAPADREDMIQQVLLGVWQEWHRFDPARSAAPTYIDRVARSKAASVLRRQRPTHFAIEELDAVPIESDKGSAVALRLDVRRTLRRLSQFDQMVALTLVEHSPTETARVLGVSRSTAYLAISRIRQAFVDAGLYSMNRYSPQNSTGSSGHFYTATRR